MTKKTKLFFDGTPLIGRYVSGVGKVLQETLRALDKSSEYMERYDVYIFLPSNEKGKLDKFNYRNIKVKYLPYPHKFLSLFSRMRLSPPLDIFLGRGVYVFENFRNWNLLLSKSVTYVHDVAFKVHPEFVEERNLKFLNRYIDLWTRRADAVVTVSEASKIDVDRKLGVNSSVVSNGVQSHDFRPRNSKEINAVKKKWGIPKEYYLFIGNIEPRKNLENTIKAFMAAAVDNESLVMIGGGGWRNEAILERASEATRSGHPVIRPSGYVPDDDLPALISGAKALVHFPWYEGSGLPVLQAIACGTPVASSDIPPLREVANEFEDRIVFADPDNIALMARAMTEASAKSHLKNKKSPASWKSSLDSLVEVIESL